MRTVLFARREKGRVNMKKKFAAAGRVFVLVMTLVSFVFFWKSRSGVWAKENVQTSVAVAAEGTGAPPGSMIRVFELASDETAQVPRRIVEGSTVYELDETSIVVEVSGNEKAEGADVVTFSRKVEDLSDNDLSRIDKEAVIEGISCELLSVAYKVEEEAENGMPIRYSAVCQYGGLKKYSTSYPTAWRMTARYDLCETMGEAEVVEIREETEDCDIRLDRGSGGPESGEDETTGKEEEPVQKAAIKGLRIKPEPEEGDKKKIPDLPVPLVAAAMLGAGLTVPFIIWISILTAPLYGLKGEGKYRYIGQIRMKKEGEIYAAYLTKRLRDRAELPVFQIKINKRVRKKSKNGMLRIHCPGGKRIMTTLGSLTCFTVEGD